MATSIVRGIITNKIRSIILNNYSCFTSVYGYLYSGLVIKRNEKRNLVLAALSILLALIMMLPVGAQLTLNNSQKAVTYHWGSEIVRFQGVNAAVGFGENMYPVSLPIYMSEV